VKLIVKSSYYVQWHILNMIGNITQICFPLLVGTDVELWESYYLLVLPTVNFIRQLVLQVCYIRQ